MLVNVLVRRNFLVKAIPAFAAFEMDLFANIVIVLPFFLPRRHAVIAGMNQILVFICDKLGDSIAMRTCTPAMRRPPCASKSSEISHLIIYGKTNVADLLIVDVRVVANTSPILHFSNIFLEETVWGFVRIFYE